MSCPEIESIGIMVTTLTTPTTQVTRENRVTETLIHHRTFRSDES